jgi:HSP20 family molecular chaperone IbpA
MMQEPLIDLIDAGSTLILVVALPGVIETDIDVTFLRTQVIVRAERPAPAAAYVLHELGHGMLERIVDLPCPVELMESAFEDGLLRLRLRRVEGGPDA